MRNDSSSLIDVNVLKSIGCTFIIFSTILDSNFLLFVFFNPFTGWWLFSLTIKNGGKWVCVVLVLPCHPSPGHHLPNSRSVQSPWQTSSHYPWLILKFVVIGKLSALIPMLWVMTLTDTQRLPHVCAWSLSHVWLSVTPWTIAHEAPLSMGFSRQECWSGLPFPALGDLTDPGIEPASLVSPTLAGRSLTTCGNLETHMSSICSLLNWVY